MEGLPNLPGFNFKDYTNQQFHVSQSLRYLNGYRVPVAYPHKGIGGVRIQPSQLNEEDLDDLASFHPILTYGKTKQAPPSAFIPAHVALDKKVLRFFGHFKETIYESQSETHRVRNIVILYFLEDDTICIMEPSRYNSGIPQGKLLKRHRLPKDDVGNFYHWRDLNVSMNFPIYGRVYRITNCDKFTKEFLESEGIILNEAEIDPEDPYLLNRKIRETLREYKTPSSYDSRRQQLENDRKVLRFFSVWDNRNEMFGDCRNFSINYYLADDTLEVQEIHKPNDGYDPFAMLVRRGRIPKTTKHIPRDFPTISMEPTSEEVKEYFRPVDFKIGATLVILGRKFFIHDCDNFTKAWYHENFGLTDFTPLDVSIPAPYVPKMEIPPFNGYGTRDDSMMAMKSLIPQRPKTDLPKLVDYGTKKLRYACVLDSPIIEDKIRKFLLIYNLSNDTISIQELGVRNSGFPRQKFLQNMRVEKPDSTEESPNFYGPSDFVPGAKLKICGHRFCIKEADEFVIKFMEANPQHFSKEIVEKWKAQMTMLGEDTTPELLEDDFKDGFACRKLTDKI